VTFSWCGGGGGGGVVQQTQMKTENGDLGALAPCPLVKGSGGSCNLVQEISFHIVKLIFATLRLFLMTTNLFVTANVKQLQTGGSFRILLPFFRKSRSVGVLNSAIFNSFHNRVEFGTILEGLRNFGGGWFEHLNPSRSATVRNLTTMTGK